MIFCCFKINRLENRISYLNARIKKKDRQCTEKREGERERVRGPERIFPKVNNKYNIYEVHKIIHNSEIIRKHKHSNAIIISYKLRSIDRNNIKHLYYHVRTLLMSAIKVIIRHGTPRAMQTRAYADLKRQ